VVKSDELSLHPDMIHDSLDEFDECGPWHLFLPLWIYTDQEEMKGISIFVVGF
jgi:hypothetical protein